MSYKFSLKKMNNNFDKEKNVQIDYTPVFNIQQQQKLNIIPIFNDDHQTATPGFIIEYEKPAYQTNLKYHQQLFDEKIKQSQFKTKQLLIPKPKHRFQLCAVCRSHYTDYLTHIKSRLHKKMFTQSPYIDKIIKIKEEINSQPVITVPSQTDYEDTELINDTIKKRIKINDQDNFYLNV